MGQIDFLVEASLKNKGLEFMGSLHKKFRKRFRNTNSDLVLLSILTLRGVGGSGLLLNGPVGAEDFTVDFRLTCGLAGVPGSKTAELFVLYDPGTGFSDLAERLGLFDLTGTCGVCWIGLSGRILGVFSFSTAVGLSGRRKG